MIREFILSKAASIMAKQAAVKRVELHHDKVLRVARQIRAEKRLPADPRLA